MSLWVIISLAGAGFQTMRFMLQRQLALGTLSAGGTTFARFLFSAPLVAVGMALYLSASGQEMPVLPVRFWMYGATGGLAQVLATVALVKLFQARNFAVGVAFSKTEVIASALVGFVVLGDRVSMTGFGAILLGLVGVMLLSVPPEALRFRLGDIWNRAAFLGLASGVLFSVSAVSYRAASLSLVAEDPYLRAGLTLAAVTAMQMIGMAVWLRWREPGQVRAVWQIRRVAIWVGLLSMAGSFCWFTAFTLQNAAYVKAVGQVELILSLLASLLIFRETVPRREWAGMGLLAASILWLVLTL